MKMKSRTGVPVPKSNSQTYKLSEREFKKKLIESYTEDLINKKYEKEYYKILWKWLN